MTKYIDEESLPTAVELARGHWHQGLGMLTDVARAALSEVEKDADPPATHHICVDGKRTDDYSANGTRHRPFKTLAAALAAVVASGENAANSPHVIEVMPGRYVEDLVFNSDQYQSVSIIGKTGRYIGVSVIIDGDLICTSNNDNFKNLILEGLKLNNITIEGASDGTKAFGTDLAIRHCYISQATSFKNVRCAALSDCKNNSTILFENVDLGQVFGDPGHHPGMRITARWDAAGKKPDGVSSTYLIINNAVCGPFTAERVGASGSVTVQLRQGTRLAYPGASCTIGEGCSMKSYGASIRANIENNGSIMLEGGSFISGTITGSGTITLKQPASQIKNDSAVAGASVSAALNELQNRIAALEGA